MVRPHGAQTAVRTRSLYANPLRWTGQRLDDGVALDHFLFRSYSPTLGRWLQHDPLTCIDGVKLYEYLAGNPLGSVDPLGLCGDEAGKDIDNWEHDYRRRYANIMDGAAAAAGATAAVVDGVTQVIVAGVTLFVPTGVDEALLTAALSKQGLLLVREGSEWVLKQRGWLWGWKRASIDKISIFQTTVDKLVREALIIFGGDANKGLHAFRHTDALGLDRMAVQQAVEIDLAPKISQVLPGQPFNQVVTVSGQRLQYSAYRLADGTINVGRIHGIP